MDGQAQNIRARSGIEPVGETLKCKAENVGTRRNLPLACLLLAQDVVNFDAQNRRCEEKSNGVGRDDGGVGEINAVNQPQQYAGGEQGIHAERKRFGIARFQRHDGLR